MWILLGAVASNAACASGDSSADDATPANPQPNPIPPPEMADFTNPAHEMPLSSCDQPLDAHGIAFVDLFFAVSDYCPARRMGPNLAASTQLKMIRDDAGRNCLSGRITNGWAQLILGFDGSNRNGSMPLPPFTGPLNADSAGISGVQFTLDRPPAGGLTLETAYVVGEDCFPGCEIHGDFYVMEDSGAARSFDRAGTYSFHFSDFQQAPWGEPGLQLDTTHLAGMFFHLPPGDFDFCLSDFHFLETSGAPVL
jgi:hypothetical protein